MASEPEHKSWYKTARWQRLRKAQLKAEPFCVFCLSEGVYTLATVCDHKDPHRGDEVKFWSGPFQSLCKPHHDSDKKLIEAGKKPRQRIGPDGWPIKETEHATH